MGQDDEELSLAGLDDRRGEQAAYNRGRARQRHEPYRPTSVPTRYHFVTPVGSSVRPDPPQATPVDHVEAAGCRQTASAKVGPAPSHRNAGTRVSCEKSPTNSGCAPQPWHLRIPAPRQGRGRPGGPSPSPPPSPAVSGLLRYEKAAGRRDIVPTAIVSPALSVCQPTAPSPYLPALRTTIIGGREACEAKRAVRRGRTLLWSPQRGHRGSS